MTPAQRAAIYGESPNAPQHTSNVSEAQAEAKQKQAIVYARQEKISPHAYEQELEKMKKRQL